MSASPSRPSARIAAAFHARSLLFCQMARSSGIARGSRIAASASTARSRRFGSERCSIAYGYPPR